MDKEDVLYHTHDGILPSRKRNEIMPFAATWMDLEMIILSEVSHKKRDKYIISLICGIKNTTQVNLCMKQTHRHREQTCGS